MENLKSVFVPSALTVCGASVEGYLQIMFEEVTYEAQQRVERKLLNSVFVYTETPIEKWTNPTIFATIPTKNVIKGVPKFEKIIKDIMDNAQLYPTNFVWWKYYSGNVVPLR